MVENGRVPEAGLSRIDINGPRRELDAAWVVSGVGPGTGIADAGGRVLWVDNAFCSILRRSRGEIVGAGLAEVLALDPAEMADAAIGGGVALVPAKSSTPAQRVTPVTDERGHPWAFVVELEINSGEPIVTGPVPTVAAFALDGDANLVAVWGGAPDLLGFGPGVRGGPVTGGEALLSDLVRRAIAGQAATAIALGGAVSRELHLFPGEGPADGRPGVIGVAVAVRPHPDHTRPLDRQTALTDLARVALEGIEVAPLLEETARLVRRALGALACAIFEYLPDRRGLLLRTAVDRPAAAPRVVPASWPHPAGRGDPRGSPVIPIGGSPPFGCLVVHLDGHFGLTADETRFVSDAADIVTVALRRLAADGRQRHAALHDALTGLPNRALILDHLGLALARSQRQPSLVAVLFVDLGRFKLVNDTLGHEVGDELLVAVAERLLGVLRPSDTLGRLGGDEFMVVCEDLAGEANAVMVAQRLAAAFEAAFPLRRFEVSATASIGVALSQPGVTDPAVLLADADAAMYRAKQRDGTAVAIFDEKMRPGLAAVAPLRESEGAGARPGSSERQHHDLVSRLAGMLEDVSVADPIGVPRTPR
jgi:diguanylate cyclase (GGDEF)-like protein